MQETKTVNGSRGTACSLVLIELVVKIVRQTLSLLLADDYTLPVVIVACINFIGRQNDQRLGWNVEEQEIIEEASIPIDLSTKKPEIKSHACRNIKRSVSRRNGSRRFGILKHPVVFQSVISERNKISDSIIPKTCSSNKLENVEKRTENIVFQVEIQHSGSTFQELFLEKFSMNHSCVSDVDASFTGFWYRSVENQLGMVPQW